MLKQRVITAVVLAIFCLGLLFLLPAQAFVFVIASLVAVAGWEWSNLAGFGLWWQRLLYSAFILLGILVIGLLSQITSDVDKTVVRSALLVAGTWWAVALLWVQGYPTSAALWGYSWVKAIMGLLVLVPTWLALSFLRFEPAGAWLIVLVVVAVASADIGAYFTGRKFGRRKLAPEVSPGKSWEGFWGGFVCCILLALLVGYGFAGGSMMLVLLVPAALASVLGDLLESMVKRQRGVKDSGALLPGHGGILDRVDSITAAAPIFALALILSGWQVS